MCSATNDLLLQQWQRLTAEAEDIQLLGEGGSDRFP